MFRLKSAYTTFQRSTDINFSSVRWKFVLAYLADAILFPKTIEDNCDFTHTVHDLLQKRGIDPKLGKCKISRGLSQIFFCVLLTEKLQGFKVKCDATCHFQPLSPARTSDPWICVGSKFQQFLSNFAAITTPPNRKESKGASVESNVFTKKEKEA